ncbi:hypothetical protein [Burkholderia sp. SRS-W-2-2016]|uniref:hypothetical protein n=1 Tax=Burkholderia sp. SRS-W-2-2016 TaxID=1926878 RepID=UPI000A803B19|nr:hypothetical protein [Burkholderia sp. SRS-W-2-2016]
MRIALLFLIFSLSGCGYYFTPRPPIMERKLGATGSESIGALATSADYRVVYVQIQTDAPLCIEAPPDAAGQSAAALAATLSAPVGGKPISADAQYTMAVAIKQLFQRSQGVQFFRDNAFALCNWYLNAKHKDDSAYLAELRATRETAAKLIEKELENPRTLSYDTTPGPVISAPWKPGKSADGAMPASEAEAK